MPSNRPRDEEASRTRRSESSSSDSDGRPEKKVKKDLPRTYHEQDQGYKNDSMNPHSSLNPLPVDPRFVEARHSYHNPPYPNYPENSYPYSRPNFNLNTYQNSHLQPNYYQNQPYLYPPSSNIPNPAMHYPYPQNYYPNSINSYQNYIPEN